MRRIWHQSITDLARQANYAVSLREQARTICGPGTEVDIHGVSSESYPDGMSAGQVVAHPWAHYMLNVQIIENARRAEHEGYDAVAIGCFHDPGLREARSAVDIPVVGMCESSLVAGMGFAATYGLLCLHGTISGLLRSLVDSYGFGDRVVSIEALDPPVSGLELEDVYRDPTLLTTRVKDLAERCAAVGAEMLIPAEGILNTLFVHHGISELAGLPVLDTYGALLSHADLMLNLREHRHIQTSRRATYLKPTPAIFEHMRQASGTSLLVDWAATSAGTHPL